MWYRPVRLPILISIDGILTPGILRMRHRLLWTIPFFLTTALTAAEPTPSRGGPFLRTWPASAIDTIYIPFGSPLQGLTAPGEPAPKSPLEDRLTGIDKTLKRLEDRLTSMEKLLLLHDDKLRQKADVK